MLNHKVNQIPLRKISWQQESDLATPMRKSLSLGKIDFVSSNNSLYRQWIFMNPLRRFGK